MPRDGAPAARSTRRRAAVLGMPVVAASGGEAAYGDAMLAAAGVGVATPDDLAGWVRAASHQRRVEPHAAARGIYDDVYPQHLGLYADLRERFASLAQRR